MSTATGMVFLKPPYIREQSLFGKISSKLIVVIDRPPSSVDWSPVPSI